MEEGRTGQLGKLSWAVAVEASADTTRTAAAGVARQSWSLGRQGAWGFAPLYPTSPEWGCNG